MVEDYIEVAGYMKKIEQFVILDLFCGAGGFSFGMHENSHFKTAVALDFDEEAANTFKKNMPEAEVIVGDITDEDVKKRIVDKSIEAQVNVIIGGPPCQGFSLKGKKLGLDDGRNYLFKEYLKLVDELQPEIFVIENVKSLLSTAGGFFKEEILAYVRKLGYSMEFGILNAKDFGAPQSRERAIFICSKSKVIPLPEGHGNSVTVRDAISDLAYLHSAEGEFESEYVTEAETDYQKKMRRSSKKLFNHFATAHSKISLEKLALIPSEKGKEYLPESMKGKQKFNTTWGRLVWDGLSPTIDTRFDAPSNGTNSHPELNRSITPREAARIQSFSDDFIFYGGRRSIGRQIGNAVPPLLAKAIADRIWETYDNEQTD
ncbi:DNA-cytosine methyltransferase [Lachnospiraceae bacterium PF1-21]